MKKFFAIAIAIVMVMSLVPVISLAGDHDVVYTGSTVDLTAASVEDAFYYYIAVSEGSGMYSGQWISGYDERYIAPYSTTNSQACYSVTWSGGVIAAVNLQIENEEQTSDQCNVVCNPYYNGNSGGFPHGETGRMYANIGMYLTSQTHGGLQVGGNLIRLRYRLIAIPYERDCLRDENGYYLEMTLECIESTYLDASAEFGYGLHDVTVHSGKAYVTPLENPPSGGTLTINYLYEDGTAAADTVVARLEENEAYSVVSPFVPMFTPDVEVVEGAMQNEDITVDVTYVPQTEFPITYTGDTVDGTSLEVGDTFYWTFNVSQGSAMYSGHWLIDFDEDYLAPTAITGTWGAGIIAAVNQTIEDGTQWSDLPNFVFNMDYIGGTGMFPKGEDGNHYTMIGMYLTTFTCYGMQMGGSIARVTYQLIATPPVNLMQTDETGNYLEMPITVLESTYLHWTELPTGEPTLEGIPHSDITVENGRVYLAAGSAVSIYTVTFVGNNGVVLSTQQVIEGHAAVAPEAEEYLEGLFRFFGWSVDFSVITGDLQVYAVYYQLGDLNNDCHVGTDDALLALRAAMGTITPDEYQLFVGDLNDNGVVGNDDTLQILRYALDLVDPLV